jgi:hypothetical protein
MFEAFVLKVLISAPGDTGEEPLVQARMATEPPASAMEGSHAGYLAWWSHVDGAALFDAARTTATILAVIGVGAAALVANRRQDTAEQTYKLTVQGHKVAIEAQQTAVESQKTAAASQKTAGSSSSWTRRSTTWIESATNSKRSGERTIASGSYVHGSQRPPSNWVRPTLRYATPEHTHWRPLLMTAQLRQ